jgi:hypothetical protein
MTKLLALVGMRFPITTLTIEGQYKHFLEIEKQEFERKMEMELEKSSQLEKENELLKEEFEQMADEYERRIEELNQVFFQSLRTVNTLKQEKIGRTKENLETLQTLVNELNFIEEKNQSLSDELDEEKKQNTTVRKELDLSKQLIKQLEMKVERYISQYDNLITYSQNQEVKQKIAVNENRFRSSFAQFDENKDKMDKIVSLVSQLKELVIPEMSNNHISLPLINHQKPASLVHPIRAARTVSKCSGKRKSPTKKPNKDLPKFKHKRKTIEQKFKSSKNVSK